MNELMITDDFKNKVMVGMNYEQLSYIRHLETEVASLNSGSLLSPEVINHNKKLAEDFAKTDMVPKAYIGKPMNILIAWEMGHQLGLPRMQALQDIAVINGKPCLYGDGFLAVIKSHKDYEWMTETPIVEGKKIIGYTCTVKRKNHDPSSSTFTLEDATKAGLVGAAKKDNQYGPSPWVKYESRMLQMRARGFACRDAFPDALRGAKLAEEEQDNEYIDGETGEVVTKTSKTKDKIRAIQAGKVSQNTITQTRTQNADIKTVALTPAQVKDEVLLAKVGRKGYDTSVEATITEDVLVADEQPAEPITENQLANIQIMIADLKLPRERQLKAMDKFNVDSFEKLTATQADELLGYLEKMS